LDQNQGEMTQIEKPQWMKPGTIKTRNFKLDIERDWKEIGLGFITYKPIYRPFPRKNFWVGISIRLLWLGISIKLWDRQSVNTNMEIYDQEQRMKEISAFHYKELIAFKNHGCIGVYWKWTHFGTLIYYRSQKTSSMPDYFSMDILWFSASYSSNQ